MTTTQLVRDPATGAFVLQQGADSNPVPTGTGRSITDLMGGNLTNGNMVATPNAGTTPAQQSAAMSAGWAPQQQQPAITTSPTAQYNNSGSDPYTQFNTALMDMLKTAQGAGSNAPLYASRDQLQNQSLNLSNPLNSTPYQSLFQNMTPSQSLAGQQGTQTAFQPGISSITSQIQASNDAVTKFSDLIDHARTVGQDIVKNMPVPDDVAHGYASAIRAGDFSQIPTDPIMAAKVLAAVSKVDPGAYAAGGALKNQKFTATAVHDLLGNVTGILRLNQATGETSYEPVSGGSNTYPTGNSPTPGSTPTGGTAKLTHDQVVSQIDPNIRSAVYTTSSGNTFIDGSKLDGKLKELAQIQAGKLGIPYLPADDADVMTQLDNARLNQKTINAYIQNLLPKDATGRIAAAPGTKLSQIFQSNDQVSAFTAFRTAAINSLRATAGAKGLRINQAEISQAVDNDIPTLYDTLGTAQQKYQIIMSLLDNTENSIIPANRSGVQPANASTAGNRIRVQIGNQTGTIDASEFDPATMKKI